jgi:hypothetical protein
MGCGTICYHNFTISLEKLRKLCEAEIVALESHRDFEGWGDLAMKAQSQSNEIEDLNLLLENLFNKFKQETTVDGSSLELQLTYYDKDNGDRYDEVNSTDGCVFCVYGVMRKSLPGEKFNAILEENVWTQFG